jgi:hypothetical protein
MKIDEILDFKFFQVTNVLKCIYEDSIFTYYNQNISNF